MKQHAAVRLAFRASLLAPASAQRPAAAPATAPAGKALEVRDLIKSGTTTIIVGTAGTDRPRVRLVVSH